MRSVIILLLVIAGCAYGQLPEGVNHPCFRTCYATSAPMQCVYDFNVEWFQTMSMACFNCPGTAADCNRHDCITADGFARPIQVVNRKMPGPSIQVCYGDEVKVIVHNHMNPDSTTIHWHGMHQVGTPYMDGVPFVTQCPVHPENSFTYRFRATEYGTHLWHSHSGLQRGNGVTGPLIVRRQWADESRGLYDYDLPAHMVFLQDWTQNEANEVFIKRYHDGIDEYPRTILVNGKGTYVTGVPGTTGGIPPVRYVVTRNYRYRFRIISSAYMDVPITMTIDGHKMKVIASDGADIVPVDTDVLTILAGERYDIVVTANQAVGLYWIKFRGLVMGELGSAFQGAVLQYETASSSALPTPNPLTYATAWTTIPNPVQVNGFNAPPNNIPIDNLRNAYPFNAGTTAIKHFVTYDLQEVYDERFQLSKPQPIGSPTLRPLSQVPRFNNLALKMKPFPLLSQSSLATQNEYCNAEGAPAPITCQTEVCRCLHVIKVPLNSVNEIIFIDKGELFDVSHPIHIHGHYFSVLGTERLGNRTTEAIVRDLDQRGLLRRNLKDNIEKDTVEVPDGGYTVVRFMANNPGFWLMHCHLEFHSELGMGLIWQVGELNQMPAKPNNFPVCGDFTDAPAPPPW